MAIITISRELGSGGGLITQMIVNTLNYRQADKELIGKIMLKYGVLTFMRFMTRCIPFGRA